MIIQPFPYTQNWTALTRDKPTLDDRILQFLLEKAVQKLSNNTKLKQND